MGGTYLFTCTSCKYHAEVSGGKDRGFVIFTETKICQDCRELLDVMVAKEKDINSRKLDSVPRSKQHCPNGKSHKLKTWKPHVCPKCGSKMKRGALICLWD